MRSLIMPNSLHKPIIHFVHGNSFPAGTYRVFLDYLRPRYDVQALEVHGHNPAYPVTDGWAYLVQELIDTLAARYSEPVILVGHSLGGILSLMAAKARPDLVRCVMVLDSPVVAGWRAMLLRVFKFLGADKKFSPARFSEKRRHIWEDAEAAYRHFASKEMFAIWPPEVLRDYIAAGTVPHADGVTLRFRREIETAIYLTLPHHLGSLLHKPLVMPVGFVGGTESVECRQAGLAAIRRLVGKNLVQIQAGHLLPMEAPQQTAAAVLAMLASFNLSED